MALSFWRGANPQSRLIYSSTLLDLAVVFFTLLGLTRKQFGEKLDDLAEALDQSREQVAVLQDIIDSHGLQFKCAAAEA